MKTRTHWNQIIPGALLLAALVGAMSMAPAAQAQPTPAPPKVDNRFLFVFDTAAEMKRCLPAVQSALESIMTPGPGCQLRTNDSLGVWTFDQELHSGQYPLQRWRPDKAALMGSNISAYVGSQRYTKKTGFDVLVPMLNQIVRSSERLTVVIFCDGNGEIHGTPYDIGINQVFRQRQTERQKARLPIAIVIRSQLGEYVDCMVSFPPQVVSFPAFPPLPQPEPPKVAPAPPPRPVVPPLIIIGTPPTNRPPPSASKSATTNPTPAAAPRMSAPAVVNGMKPPVDQPLMSTSAVPIPLAIESTPLSPTNAPPSSDNIEISRTSAFAMGVIFLAMAGGLTYFMFRRARTMKKD
jgi:hypothetical protein